jgi:hypothetical protein
MPDQTPSRPDADRNLLFGAPATPKLPTASQTRLPWLAETAGFEFQSIKGSWWFYTATFVKI